MAQVINFVPKSDFYPENTIIKIIDGEVIEFIDVDDLPASGRAKFFSGSGCAPEELSPDALILNFKQRLK